MLCPEVWNFPQPKVMSFTQPLENKGLVERFVRSNDCYRSVVITCPDELQTPKFIEEVLVEDSDYYKITNCKLHEFLDPTFIEFFVKTGEVTCLSIGRNCVANNCATITPSGVLTLHVLEYLFQSLGLNGTKRSHNFYEVNIDLKHLKDAEKTRKSLDKLEPFDFFISWIPNNDQVCPSSIAKYFYNKGVKVDVCSQEIKKITPNITEIPSLKDAELDELVEWIGMVAIEGELDPKESFISTYSPPETVNTIKSSRLSVLIVKGFLLSSNIAKLCEVVGEYVCTRELPHYWASVSVQDFENSYWQWRPGSPKMFQAHTCSRNIFFTSSGNTQHSVASATQQTLWLKYTLWTVDFGIQNFMGDRS